MSPSVSAMGIPADISGAEARAAAKHLQRRAQPHHGDYLDSDINSAKTERSLHK